MKSGRPTIISIAITFVLAAVFYFVAYEWLSKRQTGKGPWHVVFTNDVAGTPEIIITQTNLGLSNVCVRFLEEKLNATQHVGVVNFVKPEMAVPFGTRVFDDLMFLPGTVTLDCFGHEVELLPRVLVLNRKTVPWQSNTTNALSAAEKLPAETRKPRKK